MKKIDRCQKNRGDFRFSTDVRINGMLIQIETQSD